MGDSGDGDDDYTDNDNNQENIANAHVKGDYVISDLNFSRNIAIIMQC